MNMSRSSPDSGRHPRKPQDDHHHAFQKASNKKNGDHKGNVLSGSNGACQEEVNEAGFQEKANFKKAETDVLRDKNGERGNCEIREKRPIDFDSCSPRGIAISKHPKKPSQVQARQS